MLEYILAGCVSIFLLFVVFHRGIPRTTRILLFLLAAPLFCVMLANLKTHSEPPQNTVPIIKPIKPPIPIGHVMVGDDQREVRMRTWCGAGKPCTMMAIEGVYWEVDRDGEISIVFFDERLRFERGYFEKLAVDEYTRWVPSASGDYLLAKAGIAYAYIIHYPLVVKPELEDLPEETTTSTNEN